jgi:golgi phosphoprotein 3
MPMLGFVEEIVLLQLDDRHGSFVDLPQSAADVVIAGAALMELALANRVDADLERLIVVDAGLTGDDILDGAMARLTASGDELTSAGAVALVTLDSRKFQEKALERLVAKGVLRQIDGRWLWVFHSRRYPVLDDREQREVKTRLRQVLLTDEIPDPRDVVLICLIDACGLLGLVLTPDEIARTGPRIEKLARLDLIGQAVTRAVAEIRFIVKHATTPIY